MQILIVKNGKWDWAKEIRDALRKELKALSWPSNQVKITTLDGPEDIGSDSLKIEPVGSSVVVYLHNPANAAVNLEPLQKWVDEERCLPVVEKLSDAGSLRKPLDKLNACPIDDDDGGRFVVVVEHALTRLLLARRDRKVFLSYRRADSERIADALQHRMALRKHDVFLDVIEIPFGTDAQERVHAALTDADVVLLLASPNMESSQWVMEEVTLARSANVPLLVALWPEALFPKRTHPAFVNTLNNDNRLDLVEADFVDADAKELDEDVLDRIIRQMELNRVRGIVQRTRELRALLIDALAPNVKQEPHKDRPSDVMLNDAASLKLRKVVRVLPFRPTADAIHDLSKALEKGSEAPDEAVLFFHEPILAQDRTAALRWLLDVDRVDAPKRFRLCNALENPGKKVLV